MIQIMQEIKAKTLDTFTPTILAIDTISSSALKLFRKAAYEY